MKTVVFIFILFSMPIFNEAFAQKNLLLQWSVAGQLPSEENKPHAGLAGAIVGWNKNMLLVAGGANFPDSFPWQGGRKKYHSTIYLFQKNGNKFTAVSSNQRLTFPLAYAAHCTTKKGIVVVGGENEKGLLTDAILLQFNSRDTAVTVEKLPALPVATSNGVAVVTDEIIYIIGGETAGGTTSTCWKLDLNQIQIGWKIISSLPVPLSFTTGVAIGNRNSTGIAILGGRSKVSGRISDFSSRVFFYSPANDKWSEMASLPYPISAGTSVGWKEESILLFGGDRGKTFSQVEQKLVEMASAKDNEYEKLVLQKNELLSHHPGFNKDVLLYHLPTGKTRIIGIIPYSVPVTTTAIWMDSSIVIPSGEVRAGVRTPNILLAQMKSTQ
jgi:N-acetylneuraminate epimerase